MSPSAFPEAVTQKSLHFSVQGKLITDIAREKLYYSDDLPGALELVLSCLVTDQLSDAERAGLALAIIDGRKAITGTYPGPDYGVIDVPENKRPRHSLTTYFQQLREKLAAAQNERRILQDKLICISDHIPEYKLAEIDQAYRSNYAGDHEDEPNPTIFGTTPTSRNDPTDSILGSALLSSFIQRQSSKCTDPDYGWLFPDGTFYPVDFAEHSGWAYRWLREHDPEWTDPKTRLAHQHDISAAGDYLVSKYHAVLLHNPGLGVAFITGDTSRLTKAQKEFLTDYYNKRGLPDKVKALWADDD